MGLCLPRLPSLPSLPNAPVRSRSALNAFKRFQNVSRCSRTLPSVPKFSLCQCLLTYIHTYHTIPYWIMLPSLPSLLSAPTGSQNVRNVFKRFHNASRRSTTLPNVLKLSLCLCLFTYHAIPYGTMLTIPPYSPQKPYMWDRPGNLYQVLLVLQFQASSFSRCVCLSCTKHVGNLYLSVTFRRMQDSIIGSFVFLKP